MNLNDKIKQILIDKNISPSYFADEIGIQRSSVSHILAGRNKPSLDIVQKIIRRFPEIGLNWILDDGDLPESFAVDNTATTRLSAGKPAPKQNTVEPASRRDNRSEHQAIQQIVVDANKPVVHEKKIERVMIFYSDGTFQEFKHAV